MINYEELSKLYYTIGEVAKMFDVNNSLIRYWEQEFPMLKPSKNRKGDRKYTKKDIQMVESIYILVKKQGFTLDGAKTQLKNRKNNTSLNGMSSSISSNDSTEIVSKLKEIKARLNFINSKIR